MDEFSTSVSCFLQGGLPFPSPHPRFVESQQRPVQQRDAPGEPRQRLGERNGDFRQQVRAIACEAFMGRGIEDDLSTTGRGRRCCRGPAHRVLLKHLEYCCRQDFIEASMD